MSDSMKILASIAIGVALWYFRKNIRSILSSKLESLHFFTSPTSIHKFLLTDVKAINILKSINGLTSSTMTPNIQQMNDVEKVIKLDMEADEEYMPTIPPGSPLKHRRRFSAPSNKVPNHPDILSVYTVDYRLWTQPNNNTNTIDQIKSTHNISNSSYNSSSTSKTSSSNTLSCTSVEGRKFSTDDSVFWALYHDVLQANDVQEEEDGLISYPIVALTVLRQCHISLLTASLDSFRGTPFDASNPYHVNMLSKLWYTMTNTNSNTNTDTNTNTKPFEPISEAWSDYGFQGLNPATDFRGGGILSLHQLIFFADRYPSLFNKYIALHRELGLEWFGYAITGINITFSLLALVSANQLDFVFYRYGVSMSTFNQLYALSFVYLENEWHKLNAERVREKKPKVTVMDFNVLLNKVMKSLIAQCEQETLDLTIHE